MKSRAEPKHFHISCSEDGDARVRAYSKED